MSEESRKSIIYDKKISFQRTPYKRQGVYRNVINYLNDGNELISIVNARITPGPRRIRLPVEADLRYERWGFSEIIDASCIKEMFSQYQWKPRDFACLPHGRDASPDRCGEIQRELQKTIDDYLATSDGQVEKTIYRMIDERLTAYIESGNTNDLLGLLGFGPGLTPLGDDVLLGLLLCKNELDYDPQTNKMIAEASQIKTLPISSSFLKSVCEREYSDDYSEFLDDIFRKGTLQKSSLQKILDYGATSGYGILIGFTAMLDKYIKEGSENGKTGKDTRKQLL